MPITRITEIYLLLMATVYLLFAGFNTYADIAWAKYLMFCLLTIVYMIFALIACRKEFFAKMCHPCTIVTLIKNTGPIEKCLVLYLMVTWISAIASEHFPYTIMGASRFEGAITITFYVLACLLISRYGMANKTLLIFFSVATVIFDVICIIQILDYNPFNLFPEGLSYSGADVDYAGAYVGTIGNVDLVGAFFSIAIPVFLVSVLKLKGKRRLLILIPLSLTVYVLIRIKVYASIVGLTGIILALAFIYELPVKKRIRMLLCIFAFFLMVGFFLYFITPDEMLLYQIHEILRGNFSEEFGTYRMLIWDKVINLVSDCPVLGHGPDTMIFGDFGEYGEYDYSSGMYLSYIDVAHNEYLNVLYHQGILGLVAFVGIIAHVVMDFVKNGGKNERVVILGTAIICYSIQAIFGISMCISAFYFWICLGLFIREKEKGRKNDIK